MNILAIIPARSGSKSIPNKNIRSLAGKPMLAYSIEQAKNSSLINRVILDTDSAAYAKIGQDFGAEVPYLRPSNLAEDHSTDFEVFLHCLTFLKEKEGYEADFVVQLRPTYPLRRVLDIDKMIEQLRQNPEADSIRSISLAKEIPYKMWLGSENGKILPLISTIPECYNLPRQLLPIVYYQNACIDITRGKVILEQHSMTGNIILGYKMQENYDIDYEEDFQNVQRVLKREL